MAEIPLKTNPRRHVKNKRSILVVDDNEPAANTLAQILKLRGHEVSVAYTGLQAVRKTQEVQPEIVILDIGLPDIDGYEVIRLLKKEQIFSTAVIALTGYGQEHDKERALNAGFDYHLTKPAGLKELEKAFKKISHIHDDE